MNIERVDVAEIRVATYNPRVELEPGDRDYVALERSMDRFGVVEPLVWNKQTGNLVSGHQRLKILMARGETAVDVSVVDLGPNEERALNLALNKVAGRWDDAKLRDVLAELATAPDLTDFTVTGFTEADLARLMPSEALFTPTDATFTPTPAVTPAAVHAAQSAHDGRFLGQMKVRDVTCPHCGEVFGLSEGAVAAAIAAGAASE